ncbi:hypothetical protein Scep_030957 [Stephania cephalantha]|uniref:Pentatricopeptide repeat-containing protein n=1 Tax=Stephania cephalantha TaxID=152367 RepID=A0AAP0E0S9_9MAGN
MSNCFRFFFSRSSAWCLKLKETPTAKVTKAAIKTLSMSELRPNPLRQIYHTHPQSVGAKQRMQWRFFSSEASTKNGKKSFAFPDSEEEEEEEEEEEKSSLPPPYDPFSKKPVIEEPKDPKNLQEIFHKMRTEGLINNAIKMFDALSKDGLAHEAMELFAQMKDKREMPGVVGHTAVIEAYANAGGHSKEAIKVYMRMLASGVKPNAYTYTVLIKGLARDGELGDAQKYLLEMVEAGIRPNAATYTSVLEAFERAGNLEQEQLLLEKLKAKGFVASDNQKGRRVN